MDVWNAGRRPGAKVIPCRAAPGAPIRNRCPDPFFEPFAPWRSPCYFQPWMVCQSAYETTSETDGWIICRAGGRDDGGRLVLFHRVGQGIRVPAIKVDTTPIVRDARAVTSFAPVVKKAAPSVVNIYSTHIVHERLSKSDFNDPFFRQFFGDSVRTGRRQPARHHAPGRKPRLRNHHFPRRLYSDRQPRRGRHGRNQGGHSRQQNGIHRQSGRHRSADGRGRAEN